MVRARDVGLLLAGLAIIACVVSLFSPWWVGESSGSGNDSESSAGPFQTGDEGRLIEDEDATTVGVLAVVALGLLVVGTSVTLTVRLSQPHPIDVLGALLSVLGAFILVVAVLVAPLTWPPEELDVGFWGGFEADGVSVDFAAGLGWYVGLAAAVLGLVGGALSFVPAPSRLEARGLARATRA